MRQLKDPLLAVSNLSGGYGTSIILEDVSFQMGTEPLGLIGRNGMGKSTLAKTLTGMLPAKGGEILFKNHNIVGQAVHKTVQQGIAYVPQGRRIFPSLSVHEHLTMTGAKSKDRWNVEAAYELFPRLAERRRNGGGDLSGGEQQMLAIARALLTNPKLLIMDEPSEGLAPAIVDHLSESLSLLSKEGMAVLLIEQNMRFASELCDRIMVMVNGTIATEVSSEQLVNDPELQAKYMSVV